MWVYRNGRRFSIGYEGNAFIPYHSVPGTHILIHTGNIDEELFRPITKVTIPTWYERMMKRTEEEYNADAARGALTGSHLIPKGKYETFGLDVVGKPKTRFWYTRKN
jgi:hypothetical protein